MTTSTNPSATVDPAPQLAITVSATESSVPDRPFKRRRHQLETVEDVRRHLAATIRKLEAAAYGRPFHGNLKAFGCLVSAYSTMIKVLELIDVTKKVDDLEAEFAKMRGIHDKLMRRLRDNTGRP